MRMAYRLEDVDGGTALSYESKIEGGPIPLTGRVGSLALKKVKATGEGAIANLKAHVETGQVTATSAAPQRSWATRLLTLARRRPAPRSNRGARPSRSRTPRFTTRANAQILAAIEENTRAINALTEQVAQTNEQIGRVSWLTGPLDLLRRGSGESTQPTPERADREQHEP
jgi:hypothetical protein